MKWKLYKESVNIGGNTCGYTDGPFSKASETFTDEDISSPDLDIAKCALAYFMTVRNAGMVIGANPSEEELDDLYEKELQRVEDAVSGKSGEAELYAGQLQSYRTRGRKSIGRIDEMPIIIAMRQGEDDSGVKSPWNGR